MILTKLICLYNMMNMRCFSKGKRVSLVRNLFLLPFILGFSAKPVQAQTIKDEVRDSLEAFALRDAMASAFLKQYDASYDYAVFFPFEDEEDPLAGKDKVAELEKRYQALRKQVKKVKNTHIKSFLSQLNEDARINFLSRLYPKGDARRNELLNQIDVNNWIGVYNYLPQRIVSANMDARLDSLFGHDMTEFGLAELKVINDKFSNEKVRYALWDDCAKEVLNYGKDYEDIDKFWNPFCQAVGKDSRLIKKYQAKVNAIRNTKKGMMAPDFSFTDKEGQVYRLSDMRGKVIYIDCWATWCGPCCREIPFLEKRVWEYKGNDKVRFISISMDSNKNAWLKKLDKDQPQWEQFIVDKAQHDALSKAFGISGIPRFIVINADGTIADADAFRPSDEKFHEKLDEIIK